MVSTRLIKFYKGVCLEQIHKKLVSDGNIVSTEEVDELLKHHADVEKSCVKMSTEELQTLIEWSFVFARQINLQLDYPEDELDKKINLDIK